MLARLFLTPILLFTFSNIHPYQAEAAEIKPKEKLAFIDIVAQNGVQKNFLITPKAQQEIL